MRPEIDDDEQVAIMNNRKPNTQFMAPIHILETLRRLLELRLQRTILKAFLHLQVNARYRKTFNDERAAFYRELQDIEQRLEKMHSQTITTERGLAVLSILKKRHMVAKTRAFFKWMYVSQGSIINTSVSQQRKWNGPESNNSARSPVGIVVTPAAQTPADQVWEFLFL
jgi:hypothetical protein